jgi:hypothetical protein
MLSFAAVVQVARSLLERRAYSPEGLRNSLDDLARRGFLVWSATTAVRRDLEQMGLLPRSHDRQGWLRRLQRRLRHHPPPRESAPPAMATTVDYPRLIDAWLASGGRLAGEGS